jgi:hypothetical protein
MLDIVNTQHLHPYYASKNISKLIRLNRLKYAQNGNVCTKSQDIKLLPHSISTTQNILAYDFCYSIWKVTYLSSMFIFEYQFGQLWQKRDYDLIQTSDIMF